VGAAATSTHLLRQSPTLNLAFSWTPPFWDQGAMFNTASYDGGFNHMKYSNPEFDRLLTMAEGTLDVVARREIMAQLEKILQEDGPIVQPVWRAIFTFHDKRVQGFKAHPSAYIFGHQLAITT